MIIWSRWGIVVLLFVGLGVLLGFGLAAAFGLVQDSGAQNGVFVGIGLVLSAVALFVFVRLVVGTHIDKPKPAAIYEKLAEPITHENGSVQTHRVIPVLHPETGQQVYTNPSSTFFFIPLRFWPFLLAALGLVVLVVNLVVVATR
jgi:hypothetical protein